MPDPPLSARTIRRRWGWKGVLRQALEEREPNAGKTGLGWSDREMLLALVYSYSQDGAWPTGASWSQATAEHPSSRTYARRFGTWLAAIEAAKATSDADDGADEAGV